MPLMEFYEITVVEGLFSSVSHVFVLRNHMQFYRVVFRWGQL